MGIFDFLKRNKPNTPNKANVVVDNEPPKFDASISLSNLNIPVRDQFVLMLISKTRMNSPRTLGLQLDRCDFPGNEGKSVSNLVDKQLVYFSMINGFGHAVKYSTTILGEQFLKSYISHEEIIHHVAQMSNPDFMLELTQTILSKMRDED